MERAPEFSRQVFPDAPIIEALLDIRFEPAVPVSPGKMKEYFELVRADYSNKKDVRTAQTSIEISGALPPKLVRHADNFEACHFATADKKQIVQAKINGFTFNRLKPYESWEKFEPEAERLWDLYSSIIGEARIRRVGLRYINRIDIPLPVKDFKEYILTIGEIAPGLPAGVSEYFMRVVIPNTKQEISAVVHQTIESPKNDRIPFIFDIEAFKVLSMDGRDKELWAVVSQLHRYKNEIFFHSLTSRAKELFK